MARQEKDEKLTGTITNFVDSAYRANIRLIKQTSGLYSGFRDSLDRLSVAYLGVLV
jgi:hypothetical protein